MACKQIDKGIARPSLRRVLVALLVLSAFLSLSAVSSVYAKYLREKEQQVTVQTNAFYFESDLLAEGGKEYSLNPGTKEITFSLWNFADALRVSDEDITVRLTVTNNATLDQSFLILSKNHGTQQVKLAGLVDGETYKVTAMGDAGYQKTLSATFTVLTDPAAAYYYVDSTHDAYVLLTVWTGNLEGELSVNFSDTLIPDNTWPGMAEVKLDHPTVTLAKLEEYSSVTYRFFKSDKNQKYTGTDFTVKVGETDAREGKLN